MAVHLSLPSLQGPWTPLSDYAIVMGDNVIILIKVASQRVPQSSVFLCSR